MIYDLIKKQIGGSVPFAKLLGIELTEVRDGAAEATLPARSELNNHIGSQHAAALYAVAEAASGGAMAGTCAPMILEIRPVAAEAQIAYRKVAKGPIRARAQVKTAPEAIRAAISRDGKSRFDVGVELFDAANELVAEVGVQWHVSKKVA